MIKVITFGTFDLFHVGHLNVIQRAAELGDHLTVGVSTDRLSIAKKQRKPVHTECDRMRIIKSLRDVDDSFFEDSLEEKREYILQHAADILVMGDDWRGQFDQLSNLCDVVYLPRTPSISTTQIIEVITSD